jgi:DNA-directed RNA polymerase omega subunit
MKYVTADELIGKATNKYEAVVIAAQRARQLNLLEKRKLELTQELAETEEEEPSEEEPQEDREIMREVREKVTVLAMKELLEEKIGYTNESE